ncbi:MAG: hypothetical protein KA190_16760 [Kofleriaceae bacterium]|nr:hypothetical protein [Kofleriaceae bacterium]
MRLDRCQVARWRAGAMVMLVAALVATRATPAGANPYEAFVSIETEEDLYDLLASRQIGEETFDTLLALLTRGVELATAGRDELYSLPNLTYADVDAILAYRTEQGFIRDPADLVAAGALTEEKLLAIAPFLVLGAAPGRPGQAHGWVRASTRATVTDRTLPPIGVRARLSALGHVSAGAAATVTRYRLGEIVYDPNRDALLAEPESLQLHVPKVFVRYEDEKLAAIAGSYRIGFGQRLTFDNSSDYTPNGLYLDDQLSFDESLTRECKRSAGEIAAVCERPDTYVSPDFRWRETLMGVAAGAKHVTLGAGYLQAYGWGSFQRRSIYQYELVDGGACDDPRDDSNPACAAPQVYVRPDGDLLTPTDRYSFQTLPAMFSETLAGANLTYFADRRNYAGVTGYGADRTPLTSGLDLDTQEWSRLPPGGRYGAVGVNAGVGRGALDVTGEVAYSFDQLPDGTGPVEGGGGPAAIVRATVAGTKKQELEASLRYYDIDYVNPYARPIAADDEFEGQRARDELGARVRYQGRHGVVGVRASLDAWINQSADAPKVSAYVRTDVQATDTVRWGLWAQFDDKDLSQTGSDECFEVSIENDENGEPVPCTGMKVTTIGRVSADVSRQLTLTGQLQHELLDDGNHPGGFRNDVSTWAIALFKPNKLWRLRGRVRYLNEDVTDNGYLEHSIWTYVDATYAVSRRDRLRVRADAYTYLDSRMSTQTRSPSPELWLWLHYESKF